MPLVYLFVMINVLVLGKPELRPFEAAAVAVQPYQDRHYQDVYFVADSFEDMKERVRFVAFLQIKTNLILCC